MNFADKLDLLMNLTKTPNSRLSRHISLDASFISRLRRGERTPARNVSYIHSMSVYFARCCQADYQKAALWEAIKDSSSAVNLNDTEPMENLIERWLRENEEDGSAAVGKFLEGLARFPFKKTNPVSAGPALEAVPRAAVEMFHGLDGKRQAVLTFLSLVMQCSRPQTLLLYSEEDLDWLTGDPAFSARWATLMLEILKRGNRIRIVHTINRGLDEMLAAIKGWVPIYMTGAVEPYYYPKIRDGLFRRTLFIAPDCAAVTSSSVRGGSAPTSDLLVTSPEMVQALTREYLDYLALCRPLMRIFTARDQADYLLTLAEFETEGGDSIVKTDMPANLTMPHEVVESLATRSHDPAMEQLLAHQRNRIDEFGRRLQEYRFTEMFHLPAFDDIMAGQAGVNFNDIPGNTPIYYTPGEFRLHLGNIILLLKNCENYQVHLTGAGHLPGSMVYVKEDVGVLVGRTNPPPIVFAINEPSMTGSFWDYMQTLLPEQRSRAAERARTIAELETLASRLPE